MKRRQTNRALIAALSCFAALASAGCGEDFDPYERLTALRVLAIRSEPVAPAPGETTTLSALVYVPPLADGSPAPPAMVKWSWCPFVGTANAGYPCLVTEDQLRAVAGDIPPFDLMTGPDNQSAKFPHTVDPSLLRTVCAGMPGLPPPPDCSQGFPATIRLTVSTADDEVTAIRTLRLLIEPATQPNTNPIISGLAAVGAGGNEQALHCTTLKRRFDNPVRAIVTADSAESYDGVDESGQPGHLRERLFVSWFVETGTVKHPRTGFNATTSIPFADLLPNTWRPERAALYPRDQATLFAVLRDSRDGVAWTFATALLEPTP
jgi:hypothetical protein